MSLAYDAPWDGLNKVRLLSDQYGKICLGAYSGRKSRVGKGAPALCPPSTAARRLPYEFCGEHASPPTAQTSYAPTSVFAGSTACTTRPRARASITPTARSANSVTV